MEGLRSHCRSEWRVSSSDFIKLSDAGLSEAGRAARAVTGMSDRVLLDIFTQ